jgi:hypothetical protein
MKAHALGFAIKQHFRYRRSWPEALGGHPNLQVVRLRSPREVEAWLEAQLPA